MPTEGTNPVVLSAVGDIYIKNCKVMAIIWESASTAGDIVEIIKNDSLSLLWVGRTDSTHTYLGVVFDSGISCDKGFKLTVRSSGRVLVYLKDIF